MIFYFIKIYRSIISFIKIKYIVFSFLPSKLINLINKFKSEKICEIRIRQDKFVVLNTTLSKIKTNLKFSKEDK